jgi:hypothetical protein
VDTDYIFHPVTWIYWCYLCVGLLHSGGAMLVLKLLLHIVLRCMVWPRLKGFASAALVAGSGGAATHVVSIALRSHPEAGARFAVFRTTPNLAKWAIICLLLCLGVFVSLIKEFIRWYSSRHLRRSRSGQRNCRDDPASGSRAGSFVRTEHEPRPATAFVSKKARTRTKV